MDRVKQQFLFMSMVVASGGDAGGFSAHHDVAVLEGDDVRRSGDTHEIFVNLRDLRVTDDRHCNFGELP
jgi:hypothetical protein